MDAYKCDRCGVYFDEDDRTVVYHDDITLDFCPNCFEDLKRFVKSPVSALGRTCKECKHKNSLVTNGPCVSCSVRIPTFDNWEAMDGED